MTQLYDYYKTKSISYRDWQAGMLYGRLRDMFARSIEKRNPLHKSNIQHLYETKGMTNDPFQFSLLESFWKGVEHIAKYDTFPFLKVLDALIAPSGTNQFILEKQAKMALKKIRTIFKSIDMKDMLDRIPVH